MAGGHATALEEPRLVLASASPRRAHILRTLGVPFRVVVSAVDESLAPGETGEAAVERLARRKAAVVADGESLPVLAADTVVVCLGRILGKPGSEAAALPCCELLAGRAHEVVTGVCLVHRGVLRSGVERTIVTLAPMTEAERRWYVATGEPMDKAGGYHVDGKGALFIEPWPARPRTSRACPCIWSGASSSRRGSTSPERVGPKPQGVEVFGSRIPPAPLSRARRSKAATSVSSTLRSSRESNSSCRSRSPMRSRSPSVGRESPASSHM